MGAMRAALLSVTLCSDYTGFCYGGQGVVTGSLVRHSLCAANVSRRLPQAAGREFAPETYLVGGLTSVDVLDSRTEWWDSFRDGWLAHYRRTGEFAWDQYPCIRNRPLAPSPGVDLSASRLMLVSSGGFYVRESQAAFDAPNPLGDYSIRLLPTATPWDAVAIAHTHYDHAAVEEDPQVLLPLGHLRDMVADGVVGEIAPSIVSFMGYQPDVTRVVDETMPAVVAAARAAEADAVLLIPA
jgi:hypothetical protein